MNNNSVKTLMISLAVVIAVTQIVESQPGRRKKRKKEEIEDVTKQAVNEPSPYIGFTDTIVYVDKYPHIYAINEETCPVKILSVGPQKGEFLSDALLGTQNWLDNVHGKKMQLAVTSDDTVTAVSFTAHLFDFFGDKYSFYHTTPIQRHVEVGRFTKLGRIAHVKTRVGYKLGIKDPIVNFPVTYGPFDGKNLLPMTRESMDIVVYIDRVRHGNGLVWRSKTKSIDIDDFAK